MNVFFKGFLVTMIFTCFMAMKATAQDAAPNVEDLSIGNFSGGIGLLLTTPQGDFKENTEKIGVGLSADLGYVFPRLPLVVGGSFGYATLGSETSKVPFSLTVGNLVNVDVTTSNNLALGHLFLRLQPQDGVFRPYAEGLLGFNYFWTETKVQSERDDQEIASSTNLDDFVFSYGGGGGIAFRVYKGATEEEGRGVEVLVDLKVRYLLGGEAKYYAFDKDSEHFPLTTDKNGAPALDESKALQSTTDMLDFVIGVSVRI